MGRKYKLEEVETIFMSYGYISLEDSYVNSKHRMRFYCPDCGTEQTLRLNDLTQGHLCPGCALAKKEERMRELAISQRATENDIRIELKRRGLVLIGKYKTAHIKIKFQCPKHPTLIQKARISDLREYECCAACSREKSKLTYEEVFERFKSRGYMLLSTKYENNFTKMYYRCDKHSEHLQKTDVSTLTRGSGCYYCAIEKISGENHYKYNPNVPEHVRQTERIYDEQARKWRTEVFKRDRYTCKVCGETAGTLNAHHIDGYNWAVDSRYDVDNGITLCIICHRSFHSKYGFGNNTKEQFHEWIGGKR